MTIPHEAVDLIDFELGERFYRGSKDLEEKLTDEIIAITRNFIRRRFSETRRPALRDAHAKGTGCARAIFRVNAHLDPALALGVFVPGKEYQAWIRFSNGNSERLNDRIPDARGMAVKLLNVPGKKLSDDESMTQDFIMANSPTFFIDDLERYRDTLQVFHSGGLMQQFLASFKLQLREFLLASRANLKLIPSPLVSRYWSMTAYRLGAFPGSRYAIKYMVKPNPPARPSVFERWARFLSPGFTLRQAAGKELLEDAASFDFYIQRAVGPGTPVEDSTMRWDESVATPEPVAKIFIPAQDLSVSGQDDIGEHLSFNPWHSLPEHKPLGAVNRVRRRIYVALSRERHQLNKVAVREPASTTDSPDLP